MSALVTPQGPHGFPSTHRVLGFTDEYAPVHRDPDTGLRKVMTSTRFKAEGYDVVQLGPDSWAVDLDSQKLALPPGVEPPVG